MGTQPAAENVGAEVVGRWGGAELGGEKGMTTYLFGSPGSLASHSVTVEGGTIGCSAMSNGEPRSKPRNGGSFPSSALNLKFGLQKPCRCTHFFLISGVSSVPSINKIARHLLPL